MKKKTEMPYGNRNIDIYVPASATILEGKNPLPLDSPADSVLQALNSPIGLPSLKELLIKKDPATVAITISDITRPVPNTIFLPVILQVLNECGINDSNIVIIIGTGMHRPSSDEERIHLVGKDILERIEVIDHRANDKGTLTQISSDPVVSVCRRFAEADFRIVTGFIEPHFMAGFSGGRKGVCPALVDLNTVQRFHGYKTLANSAAVTGNLKNNPCHDIALQVAKRVGVDFLFNVAITKDKQVAGIYCGDLELAHQAGCQQVAEWTTAKIRKKFDFVITNGGGFPLDQTFYQTIKGMCTALPALSKNSTLLQISSCSEGIGSEEFKNILLRYNNNWQQFLIDIESHSDRTDLDQWEYQMQARVLDLIGQDKLWFVSDGIAADIQKRISVNPILGNGSASERAQNAINRYCENNPNANIAIIPEGPYTMLAAGS